MAVKISSLQYQEASPDSLIPAVKGGSTVAHKPQGIFYAGVANTASAHNSIARGENLAQWFTIDSLSAQVSQANWDNIFIGDYLDVQQTSTYATETVRWMVAGFDSYWNVGDTACTSHHLVMVPSGVFVTEQKMNDTDTTEGAFKGSKMWTTILPNYATAVKNAFGSNHVLNHRELMSKTMNSTTPSMAGCGWNGAATDWEWTDADLMLLSEVQVYGSTVYSSSWADVGNRNRQLPLFALCQDKLVATWGINGARANWWLSAVANSTNFAFVGSVGDAGGWLASHSGRGVRPLFLFH